MAVIASASTLYAAAPPMVSQAIVASVPCVDEFGFPLKGTDPGAAALGLPAIDGDLVQLLVVQNGQVLPPDTSGTPDPVNPMLRATRIGVGVAADAANPGIFSCILTPRPQGGVQIFVRVFNAPTLDEASFYADSQVFTVSALENAVFEADFSGGMKPLDSSDDDGDGLNNSWEKSLGSDPNNWDSDHDEMSDYAEMIAGTDPTNDKSYLELSDVTDGDDGRITLSWQTVAGRSYDVEGVNLAGEGSVVATIDGNGGICNLPVSVDSAAGNGFFRLRVRNGDEP